MTARDPAVRRTLARLRLVRMQLRRAGKLSLAGAKYDMPHDADRFRARMTARQQVAQRKDHA